jgi:hypothetical protein
MRVFPLLALTCVACGSGQNAPDSGVVPFACAAASQLASLGFTTADVPGYTLAPLAPNEQRPLTLTITNVGQTDATELHDVTTATDAVAEVGTTCGATLKAGASCTLSLVLTGTSLGRHMQLLGLNYYNGELYTDLVKDLTFDVTDRPFTPAAPSALPLMPVKAGGHIEHVNLVTVTFSDSTDDADVSALGDSLVKSDWYAAVAQSDGLALGTHQHVQLRSASPGFRYGGDDVLALLKSGALPSHNDGNDVYMFFFTPATAYEGSEAGDGGWHATVMNGSVRVPFAIIKPSCAGGAGRAFVAAHELIEATTDSGGGDRFSFPQGEVGDLCNGHYTSGTGVLLPTIWSNTAAATGGDPCVPALNAPFFDVSVSPAGPQTIPAGGSLTFTLTGWSTAPVGDWRVAGNTATGATAEGDHASDFTVTFPKDLINNARQLPLKVAVAPGTPAGTTVTIPLVSRDRLPGARGHLQVITVTASEPVTR